MGAVTEEAGENIGGTSLANILRKFRLGSNSQRKALMRKSL